MNSGFGVEAYNPDNGDKLWYYEEPSRFPIPVPVYHDGVIYLTRGYRSSPQMAFRVGGRGNVSDSHVEWRNATGGPYLSSLVEYEVLRDRAYGAGVVPG